VNYYNYAFEMPPNTTGGAIYVYDPVFCATAVNRGTGDRWFGGSAPVTSVFEVYNTNNSLYTNDDDGAPIATSGALFKNIDASDSTMGGGTNGAECRATSTSNYSDGRDYHLQWYKLADGLTGGPNGTTYRIHTTTTDPDSPSSQQGTDGANSFALFGQATGGTPRIYGLGAMQMFTPLSAGGSQPNTVASEFYLAQLDAVHAGKTVAISLWDPGDTNPLGASLEILVPNAGGWSPTPISYTAAKGTTNSGAANCNSLSGSNVGSVQTNVGATAGTYNGCWLTILAQIPNNYAAHQNGWWKIRYTMTGNGTSNDVTTWQVEVRGNPVHLVVP
jgi:hypothetical protein